MKPTLPNSVSEPDMSSDSASGRSKGALPEAVNMARKSGKRTVGKHQIEAEGSLMLLESEHSNSIINIIIEDSIIISDKNTALSWRSWPIRTQRDDTARKIAKAMGTENIEHAIVKGTSESAV